MGLPAPSQLMHPSPSALQTLINSHKAPPGCDTDLYNLALQIAHNLHYQHNWTNIRLHLYHSTQAERLLPRPMISGLPPQRLYIHPDEQLELLRRQKREGKSGVLPELGVESEREWVLPSHLREKWSLRRFGEVFDGVGIVPGARDGVAVFDDDGLNRGDEDGDEVNDWRTSKPKRALLAILDDDSTVVYYIVHDGIVKPRQN